MSIKCIYLLAAESRVFTRVLISPISFLTSTSFCCILSIYFIIVRMINIVQNNQVMQTMFTIIKPIQPGSVLSYTTMPQKEIIKIIAMAITNVAVFQCIFIVIIFTEIREKEKRLDNFYSDITFISVNDENRRIYFRGVF